jgi:phosphoribosyl 1,2-cyclic phosphate phosphodiesterase
MSNVKITILGSGAAPGVPSVAFGWGECNPDNPKNIRTRTGTYLEFDNNTKILIDTSPDIRIQMIKNKIGPVNGILYTHAHSDHIGGMDDLREINRITKNNVEIYCTKNTYKDISTRFSYLINLDKNVTDVLSKPSLYPNIIENYKNFTIEGIDIQPIEMTGHNIGSNGYIFNNGEIVYLADFKTIDDKVLDQIINKPKLLIIPCTTYKGCKFHPTLDYVKELINKINPEKAIINHMAIENDYDFINKNTDERTIPAYDGMVIEL